MVDETVGAIAELQENLITLNFGGSDFAIERHRNSGQIGALPTSARGTNSAIAERILQAARKHAEDIRETDQTTDARRSHVEIRIEAPGDEAELVQPGVFANPANLRLPRDDFHVGFEGVQEACGVESALSAADDDDALTTETAQIRVI